MNRYIVLHGGYNYRYDDKEKAILEAKRLARKAPKGDRYAQVIRETNYGVIRDRWEYSGQVYNCYMKGVILYDR